MNKLMILCCLFFLVLVGCDNNKEQFKKNLKSAEQGNAEAQAQVGYWYYKGKGVDKNNQKSFEWSKKSAEQGNAKGQVQLGNCYHNGIGVEKNYKKAIELYRKSAEQGNATAQNDLGLCYALGQGVEKNYKKAIELFKKSSKQGYAPGEENLKHVQNIVKSMITVKYVVNCEVGGFSVTYSNKDGNLDTIGYVNPATWEKSVTRSGENFPYFSVNAQANGSYNISTKIYYQGEIISQSHSSGEYAVSSSSAVYPFSN